MATIREAIGFVDELSTHYESKARGMFAVVLDAAREKESDLLEAISDGNDNLRFDASENERLNSRVSELENAIREHRDQRGDDRCWMDDHFLYEYVGDNSRRDLPAKPEFLESCSRYWEQRQSGVEKAIGCMLGMTMRQLQNRVVCLESQLALASNGKPKPVRSQRGE